MVRAVLHKKNPKPFSSYNNFAEDHNMLYGDNLSGAKLCM